MITHTLARTPCTYSINIIDMLMTLVDFTAHPVPVDVAVDVMNVGGCGRESFPLAHVELEQVVFTPAVRGLDVASGMSEASSSRHAR